MKVMEKKSQAQFSTMLKPQEMYVWFTFFHCFHNSVMLNFPINF